MLRPLVPLSLWAISIHEKERVKKIHTAELEVLLWKMITPKQILQRASSLAVLQELKS